MSDSGAPTGETLKYAAHPLERTPRRVALLSAMPFVIKIGCVGLQRGRHIYKRDGIDLWSTLTNFQIIRQAAWPEADRSAEISEENL